MEQTRFFDRTDLPYAVELPARWEVDDGGVSDGLVIAADSQRWSMEFFPNVTLTHVRLGPEHEATAEATMVAQQAVEPEIAAALEEYRLIHLDHETFGSTASEQADVSGVMRCAYYTAKDAVPLMMHQWVARRYGYEVSMTVTFAAADLPTWADGSWALASMLTWKEAAV